MHEKRIVCLNLPQNVGYMISLHYMLGNEANFVVVALKALLDAQKKLRQKVPGFRFNMGFSGAFFLDGDDEEDEGDWALIKNAHSFWWFSHMWGHMKPHEIKALNDLVYDMKINWEFAKVVKIKRNQLKIFLKMQTSKVRRYRRYYTVAQRHEVYL